MTQSTSRSPALASFSCTRLFRLSRWSLGAASLLVLAACGTPPAATSSPAGGYSTGAYPGSTSSYAEFGRVTALDLLRTPEPGRGTGAGAVIGGVAGAVLGNQVGSGGGRDVARIAGAVGGAVAGNTVERNARASTRESYRVLIQLDNGTNRAFEVPTAGDLRVGDRVRVENNQIFRM